jgi:hypothetical protein
MWHHRRCSVKAVKAAERRKREDDAPRLIHAVPLLRSLAIRFHEVYEDLRLAEATHVRRIVVDHAPAYFEIPCADRECEGVHDLTQELLGALREARSEFQGKDVCKGGSKTAASAAAAAPRTCGRVLHYVALASYSR